MESLELALECALGPVLQYAVTDLREQTLFEVEERIGHRFRRRELLAHALTHASALSAAEEPRDSYQRLEFLGDRVLALSIARMLYDTYPEADEGELARRLNQLVKQDSCADVAVALDLGMAMRVGEGEAQSGGRHKRALLADICEAVIAAIYLDAGFDTAGAFVERHWRDRMINWSGPLRDAKTTLQEWAQGQGLVAPAYAVTNRAGPDHAPQFTIKVDVVGYASAIGRGRSKREAEQAAATSLLEREGVWTPGTPR